MTIKAVLRVIDDHAGEKSTCFASLERIARSAGCKERAARRAVEVLRDELRIVMERAEYAKPGSGRGRQYVHRTICWANLTDLAESEPARQQLSPAEIREQMDAKWNGVESQNETVSAAAGEPFTGHKRTSHRPRKSLSAATGGFLTTYGTDKEPPPTATAERMDEAAAALSELGVEWPGPALEKARASRDDEHILAIVEFYRLNWAANGWGPGAVVRRLQNARHHTAVDRGWPAVSPKAVNAQLQSQQELQRREEAQLEAKRKQEADDAQKQREARFGPQLDAMNQLDRDDLARRKLTDLEFRHYRKEPVSCLVRRWLLRELEKETVP